MAFVAFILLVGVGNFALGFALAIVLGHGPAWADLSQLRKLLVRPAAAAGTAPASKHSH